MATVTRSTVQPTPQPAAAKNDIPLPTLRPLPTRLPLKPRKVVHDINQHPTLILGDPGTGKTRLSTAEEGVLNLSFDPVNKSYDIIQDQLTDWRDLMGYLNLLEKTAAECRAKQLPFPYKRVQVDGCGTGARACMIDVCVKLGITHPSEEGFSRGWDDMQTAWSRMIDRFVALPCGVWFISHVADKEVKLRDGRQLRRMTPEIKGKLEGIMVGKMHLVIAIEYAPGGSKARIATIRGDESTVAKCNIDGRFLTADGRPVEEIWLGQEGPAKAWERLMKAYNNGQQWASIAEMHQIIAAKQKEAKKPAAPAAITPTVAEEEEGQIEDLT